MLVWSYKNFSLAILRGLLSGIWFVLIEHYTEDSLLICDSEIVNERTGQVDSYINLSPLFNQHTVYPLLLGLFSICACCAELFFKRKPSLHFFLSCIAVGIPLLLFRIIAFITRLPVIYDNNSSCSSGWILFTSFLSAFLYLTTLIVGKIVWEKIRNS